MNSLPADFARLGAIVRDYRARRGWTQQELADAAHVSLRAVTDLEAGRVTASGKPSDTARKVAAVFDWLPGSVERVLQGGEPHVMQALDGVDEDLARLQRQAMLRSVPLDELLAEIARRAANHGGE